MKDMQNKGMTLLEVIVSLAIIAILVVAFLPAFTFSFKSIIVAGEKSDTIYQSQNETEDKLLEGAVSSAATMSIVFTEEITVQLQGEDVTKGSINVFLPN